MGYLNYELNPYEELIMVTRQHWIVLALPIIKTFLSVMIAILVAPKMIEFSWGAPVLLFWIIASIIYVVHEFMVWRLNCYIITSQRIIDINQINLFRRIVAEVDLGNIQEAVYEINGFWETVFNFGTVKIKLATTQSMIALEYVSNPQEIRNILSEAQKGIKRSLEKPKTGN